MISIIQDFSQRINTRLSPLIIASIIGTISILISFLIGRQSIIDQKEKIEVKGVFKSESQDFVKQNPETPTTTFALGRIYGSSKGKKYYIEGLCDGNISDKNKVFYKKEDDAKAKGKMRASACH